MEPAALRCALLLALGVAVTATFGTGPLKRLYNLEVNKDLKDCQNATVCGKPLFLTPYLEQGKIAEARNLSKITDPSVTLGMTAYSAFFTTNKTGGNNMFWWYWAPKNGNASAPLLIWLQGGPGGPSLFGMFSENGPVYVDDQMNLHERKSSWNNEYHVIYIDNPVGAGYSFTDNGGWTTNSKTDVAYNLFSCMEQFYQLFPELLANDLYITGESYAGHYIPGFAAYILKHNQAPEQNPRSLLATALPLKGIAIGDGWIDPPNHVTVYPDLLFYYSMFDHSERVNAADQMQAVLDQIHAGNNYEAFALWDKFLNGDIWPYPTYYFNTTGMTDYDEFVPAPYSTMGPWGQYVDLDNVRKAIHVGTAEFQDGTPCEMHLVDDFMRTLAPEIAFILDSIPVLLYNGQVDVIVAAPLTERMLNNLEWSGAGQWGSVPKRVWKGNGTDPLSAKPAGYVRTLDRLTKVVVRDAGHLVPMNQPENALEMLTKWIAGQPIA